MNEHQKIIDNIPAYALGILGDAEAEWVASHLADCAACTAELHAYQETVGLLGHAAPERQAPTALKEKIMAQAQPAPVKSAQQVQKPPRRPRAVAGTPAFSVASVAFILLLLISNLVLLNEVRSLRANAFGVINLAAEEVMPAARGLIILSADGRYGTLVASNLDELDENQQYQLWLIKGDQRTSGGVFSVSGSGYTAFQVYSREPLDSFDGFGITIEPFGGSPGPTGDKVLGAEL